MDLLKKTKFIGICLASLIFYGCFETVEVYHHILKPSNVAYSFQARNCFGSELFLIDYPVKEKFDSIVACIGASSYQNCTSVDKEYYRTGLKTFGLTSDKFAGKYTFEYHVHYRNAVIDSGRFDINGELRNIIDKRPRQIVFYLKNDSLLLNLNDGDSTYWGEVFNHGDRFRVGNQIAAYTRGDTGIDSIALSLPSKSPSFTIWTLLQSLETKVYPENTERVTVAIGISNLELKYFDQIGSPYEVSNKCLELNYSRTPSSSSAYKFNGKNFKASLVLYGGSLGDLVLDADAPGKRYFCLEGNGCSEASLQ